MELSEPVVKGLQHLANEINLDNTKKLIANTVKHILSSVASVPSVPDIYAIDADKVKLSEYAVASLLIESTKHGYDASAFRSQLEKFELHPDVMEELVRTYKEQRKDFTLGQPHIGSDFPHFTDVQWRIMADVLSSTSDCSSGEVSFHVNLGRYHETSGRRETIVEFVCSTEELQLLINKLKEVERHCEKIVTE